MQVPTLLRQSHTRLLEMKDLERKEVGSTTDTTQYGNVVTKPSTTDWTDIPEWKEGQGCPLLEIPSELLDLIFCVRPELGVSVHIDHNEWSDQ
jgi:hypothetical protein